MTRKKVHKKKRSKKKTNTISDSSLPQQKQLEGQGAPEKETLQPRPLKKDISKKATNSSTFALKRYFFIVRQFLADAKVELKKVTWPTKKELISTTAVVIVLVVLIAFFLGIVDLGLVKIIKNVIK